MGSSENERIHEVTAPFVLHGPMDGPGGLNHQIVDGFERLRRQPIEAAVKSIILGGSQ
jgi:hypothetical protein